MKTHKVDVVSGYSYPQDNHALWFDESLNVLKKYDGTKWVSGSAVSNGEENFYTKEEVVPEQVLWEGNLQPNIEEHTDDVNAVNHVLEHLTDGQLLDITLSDGNIYTTEFVEGGITSISINGMNKIIYEDSTYWYLGKRLDICLTKISIPSTTQHILVWNYLDSLPIAMPKCIEDDELGLVAVFDNRPEEGRAYYIPEHGITFVPVLIVEYVKKPITGSNSTEIPILCQWYYLSECSGEFDFYLNTIDNKYYAHISPVGNIGRAPVDNTGAEGPAVGQ